MRCDRVARRNVIPSGFGEKDHMHGRTPGSVSLTAALVCISLLATACSKSEPVNVGSDTSRLPRTKGAKEVFASPATTIFTSPDTVSQTADALEKKLAVTGWQSYISPNTAY